jgi:hypothetical protein
MKTGGLEIAKSGLMSGTMLNLLTAPSAAWKRFAANKSWRLAEGKVGECSTFSESRDHRLTLWEGIPGCAVHLFDTFL